MIALLTSTLGKYLFAGLLAVMLIGGIYLKGRSDGEAKIEAAVAAANKKADERAEKLSNELVIQQAIAMSVTAKEAKNDVTQIRAASNDADRSRIGSRSVRDLIRGAPSPAK